MSKKILSFILAFVMVFSLAAPIVSASEYVPMKAATGEEASDLRVGILSDIHVSYDYVDEVYGNVSGYFNGVQPGRFEKALRFFKAQGVDAVVVAGDLQEASGTSAADLDKQKDWLQTVVDIWFEVFPEKPGEEGYVEPIFTYGNHDSALVAAQYWPKEWGTYEDAFIKTVNGYSFVCAHNAKESLAAPLLEKVAAANQDKPIFYIQHCPIYKTVPGDYGYGLGYGEVGWKNAAPYHNIVSFNGHTHAPLTDERCIWQGDAGNEGQFTVINTATINYTGLSNDGMSVNPYNGNAQQTEHAMIMNVSGSQVSVDRYSLNDMAFDTATNTLSGEAVKIGETWSWDACDITDRPYAYDYRYATANAPVFADDAAISIKSITDTSVTVSIPAASLTAPEGYSDMIEGYVVEACNPTSGEVEAVGRVATSYHVDDKADAYEPTYTVTVSGLKPGTAYVLKAYAQEFFDKRSEPLTAELTTTGLLAQYRRGDVNEDGIIDSADMDLLLEILSKPGEYIASADVDMNSILETRDVAELQAIFDGKKITWDSGDLMDLVTSVKLTGASTSANYQPVDYGTVVQNQVVRGDSNRAVKTWTTNYAYYPVTTMYFDVPVDLSGFTHLSFDTLFENEYSVSDSYRKRWLSVSFISGEQEQIASYGSMNFDANGEGWSTKTISLATLKNIDLTAVTGIRFSHNFDYYEGRYDGVTEHAIYWDNFYGVVIEGSDGDLLSDATISGGEIVYGAGYTNNTNQAIQSTGGTLDYTFESPKVMTDFASVKVDIRTPVTTTVQVQALDENGNVIGNPVFVNSCSVYRAVNISVPGMGLADGTMVYGLRFSYSCESLLLDNMFLQGSKDYDLIGTASSFISVGGDSCTAMITTEGGNGSNNALYAYAAPGTSVWSGGGELTYDVPLDLSETPFLRFDMKVQNAHWAFSLVLYNSQGEEIWRTTHYNATSSGGQYATYEFDLRTYRTYDDETGYIYHEVTAQQLSDVAKIRLTSDLASNPTWMVSNDTAMREVWFDNLVACNPLNDFFGADTSLIGPSAVQDGFVCEIMPSTDDGRTNVLHWYSDSSKNAGTTSAWPGETTVTFTQNVNLLNHSGYTGSYDYLEFDIKTVGMYIAMYLTVLDANGATLGSTGEYRISYEQEWSTYRVDASALGMSAEDFSKIAQVKIGWNWQHQDANGTAVQYMADVYIDNMGLRSVPADSTDLLDELTLIRNQDWWTGANGKFTGGGWKFQSDVTAESDNALMFFRSETSQNISYGSKTLYMYFQEPVSLDAKWSLEIDAIKHNYNASGAKVQIIASDGNKYDLFAFTHTEAGVHTYSTLVSAIAGFDPATMTVTGLYFTYPMNPDNSMDKAADGYLVLDNLKIAIPEPMDEDDFLYSALCASGQNQTAVTNNSLSAWRIEPANLNTWSYPQFTFEAVDISNHTLTMDIMASGMSNFRMHLANMNGDWAGNSGAAVTYAPGKWVTVSFDLSNNGAGITSLTAFSLGIECIMAEDATDYALYIDNVTLTENVVEPEPTEPEPTEPEPEPTEPEATEPPASPNPEDPGDLLGSTNNVPWNPAHWDNYTGEGTGLTAAPVTDVVYGSSSTRSWAFKATAAANRSEAVAQLAMAYAYNMSGKMLVFDVLFDCADSTKSLTLNTRLHEAGSWADVTTNLTKTLKPGCWQTVALDFSKCIVSGKDLSQVQFITFTIDFGSNTGVERALYIDNVRLVDVETFDDDMIHCNVDTGSTGNQYWLSDEHTYGHSSLSMRLENLTSGDNDIYYNTQSQFGNSNLPNFKNKIISAYFYFGDQTPYATLQLVDKNWSGVVAYGFRFESVGDGWYLGQVNTARLTTHAATTDLSECIRFAINIKAGAVVYIDDLKVLDGESGLDDWTNISLDTGATKGEYGPNTEFTYGDDSNVSMRFEPTGGAYISFHTQNEVSRNNGAWDAYPDFSKGLFSAYIYFGDQTPSVKIQLTDIAWKNSTATAMNLESVGDGWYHATIDLSAIQKPEGFDISQVIRVYLTFTAGQKVYIDNMSILPLPNCMEDHLATSPGVRRPTSGIESGYVIEILDSYDGYSNVFHVMADPNNGSGTTTNWPDQPSYYVGESGASYSADEYDYYEFTFKGTGHYSDISVTFLDANNVTLGSVSGFRMSHKDADWMTFRIDLASAGLTAEEVKLVRRVSFGFNWQYQNSSGTALLKADLYWRDCGFRALDEDSTNVLDQIHSIKNSDYWYGGYNNYPGAGWYFDDSGAFTFFRSTNTSGLGYASRNMYVYFKTPISVKNGERLSLDIVNTNFPLSSKLEIIGSDGKYYVFGNVNQKGSYNLEVCVNNLATADGVAFDPATVQITGIKFYNNFNPDANIDTSAGGTLAYTSLTVLEALPNAADDMFAQFERLTGPAAVQENFVTEYLEETDDGRLNVIRIAASTDNGLTTSNWPGTTKVYFTEVPAYVDTTAYDFFEFQVKNTGIKYALYIAFYDASGTSLGSTSEVRMSNGCGWATHRLDLATIGLTAEEIYQIDCVEISVSWEYNNANGSTMQAGELLCDNFRFGSVEDDSTDLLDHVTKTSLLGSGATTKFPGSDWYFNEDGGFVITRDSTSTGWVTMRLYFDEAITVESDWTVSCYFDITNFHHGGTISLIGSDGKVYGSVGPNKGGQNTVSKAVTDFAVSGTAFDPATVQIAGIHISYSLGTSNNVTDAAAPGYMLIDNLILTDPS